MQDISMNLLGCDSPTSYLIVCLARKAPVGSVVIHTESKPAMSTFPNIPFTAAIPDSTPFAPQHRVRGGVIPVFLGTMLAPDSVVARSISEPWARPALGA